MSTLATIKTADPATLARHLARFHDDITSGLAHRSRCAAAVAEGKPAPPAPHGVPTGDQLDLLLEMARAAALFRYAVAAEAA